MRSESESEETLSTLTPHFHSSLLTPASLIYALPSIVEPVDLNALFPAARPLEVELGCGDGSFLIDMARRFPDRDFLGLERLWGRLRKIDRKGRRAGIQNLRLIRLEASYFLQYLLRPGTVSVLHVYFPDPWPKRRHHKHRLITPQFAGVARAVLAPEGAVYFRTDNAEYFAQITSVFGAHPGFCPAPTPDWLAALTTDFERDFLERGVPILRAAYVRGEE